MRQSIRGYADGVGEQVAGGGTLQTTAAEMAAVRDLVDGSDDLRHTLLDPGVPAASRRAVMNDLLRGKVGEPTLRLLAYTIETEKAPDAAADLSWMVTRLDAAARGREAGGETVLGHKSAEERVDGYATAILETVGGTGGGDGARRALGEIEDELFRFMRIVGGSEELRNALSNRVVPASARKALVVDLLRERATPATTSLAVYATQVGRPRDFEALLAYLVDRVASESSRRLAEVRAAIDLDTEQRQHLASALSRVAGHAVDVRVTVDPSILGGFVATIGDTVVDGSTRHRLELLRERLDMPEAEHRQETAADG
ncbi:MAG: F0F1 ATP synthase subunit delta [Acidimicrobiales bacterium]